MPKRKGRSVRKNKHVTTEEPEEISKAPHSFVVHRGKTGKFVQELCRDFRQVMEPFTASGLKARPKNTIKDFVHVAGLLKVSHFCVFSKTNLGPYLKIARFPRGPTMSFRVTDYTLARDVRSSLRRQVTYEKQYLNHALLIMNNFTGEDKGLELTESMFRNMFPNINVTKVKLNTVRRAVLLNYNKDTKTIDFRHYTIKVVPVGVTRSVKKIVSSKVPNLGKYDDMADFLTRGGAASESEAEDDETSHVTLPQAVSSRGNMAAQQSSVRLVELGPRMTLQLIKIEDGLLDGEVLYHDYIEKTDEEVKEIRAKREKKKKEKEKRKNVQAENVRKKEKAKEDHKQKSLDGMNKKKKDDQSVAKGEDWMGEQSEKVNDDSDDDDEEWYKKEVGEQPEKDLFAGDGKKRGHFDGGKRFNKKGRGGKPGKGFKRSDGDAKSEFKGKKGREGKKGKLRVYNSDGVGPNFSRKGGKKGLKGVRGGKVQKKRR